jgi:hypothetical protein
VVPVPKTKGFHFAGGWKRDHCRENHNDIFQLGQRRFIFGDKLSSWRYWNCFCDDMVVMLSKSGETEELVSLMPLFKRDKIMAWVSNPAKQACHPGRLIYFASC